MSCVEAAGLGFRDELGHDSGAVGRTAKQFDALVAALDVADEAPNLARAFAGKRQSTQH